MQKIGLYMCNQKNGTVQVRNFVFLYINNTYIARRDLNHAILIEWYSTGGGGGGGVAHGSVNILSTWFHFSYLLFDSFWLIEMSSFTYELSIYCACI